MKGGSAIIANFVAGIIGGILVVLLAFSNPALVKKFVKEMPSNTRTTSTAENQVAVPTTHEQLVIDAVEKAKPAVVSIVITKDVPILERYYEEAPNLPFDPFGNFPFQFRIPQYRQNGTQKREVGGGSGFLISADGLVITNRHVVAEEDAEYTVFTNDGTKYEAKILARDSVTDIAVLKIEAQGLPFLSFANSDQLNVGQTAIAIGNALGEFRNTVSVGVVSGLSRSITAGDNQGQSEQLEEVIQTDAAINPGNSGGPLLNSNGEVIGVNVAVAQGSENIGFALPANIAKSIVDSVQKTGRIIRPYLGVRYLTVTSSLQEKNNLSVDYGVLVTRGETAEDLAVIPGSPADKAGIEESDIILEADGVKLDETHSLAAIIRKKGVGQELHLKILRDGREQDITATLGEAP